MLALSCHNLACEREFGVSSVRGIEAVFHEHALHGVAGGRGSGSRLLLRLLGLLQRPDSGQIRVFDRLATAMPEESVREIRNSLFGYLFEGPCLLPAFTVAENVAIPLFRFSHADPGQAGGRTRDVLRFAGIENDHQAIVDSLSSDIQHRTAFARAIVHRPRILIAFCPRTPDALLPLARRAVDELGMTGIWTGEHQALAAWCDRVIELHDGRIVADHLCLR